MMMVDGFGVMEGADTSVNACFPSDRTRVKTFLSSFLLSYRNRAEGVKNTANDIEQKLNETKKAIKKSEKALKNAQNNLNNMKNATAEVQNGQEQLLCNFVGITAELTASFSLFPCLLLLQVDNRLDQLEDKQMELMMRLANISVGVESLRNKTEMNRQMAKDAQALANNATEEAAAVKQVGMKAKAGTAS